MLRTIPSIRINSDVWESAFVQYLFNMDNPHYITMAIFLCVSAYENKEINVADLKKKLTCSDRQVDIMIQTLIDKKFILV